MNDDNKKPNADTQRIPSSVNPDAKPASNMNQNDTEHDNELTVKIKPEVEGFGDAESHTIDLAVAETIGELIRQNLRNRYEHLAPETEINVIGLSAPNTVAIHYIQPGDEGEDNGDTSD